MRPIDYVFGHNDLKLENIIKGNRYAHVQYKGGKQEMTMRKYKFVDFEHSGINLRGCDLVPYKNNEELLCVYL